MPSMQPTDDQESAIAEQLDGIGDEFGCHRLVGESNEHFGLRLLDYLDEMIGELRGSQDQVRELIV